MATLHFTSLHFTSLHSERTVRVERTLLHISTQLNSTPHNQAGEEGDDPEAEVLLTLAARPSAALPVTDGKEPPSPPTPFGTCALTVALRMECAVGAAGARLDLTWT